MKDFFIDNSLTEVCPNIALGCISYQVTVKKECTDLWKYIEKDVIPNIKESVKMEQVSHEKNIKETREIYKKLKKDPNRYRVSSESLIRRILQDKGLYKINNIVDINNLISIVSRYSVGSYDLSKLGDSLCFRVGFSGETYKGIGKEIINIENLPVFSDELGAYGSPTSDSERAMITLTSHNILTIIISFSGVENIEYNLHQAKKYLELYTDAHSLELRIIKA